MSRFGSCNSRSMLVFLANTQHRTWQSRGFRSLQQLVEKRDNLIDNFKALPEIRLNDKKVTKSAAVLIALCETADKRVSLLYTLRSSLLKSHTRQVSFPGGVVDPTDRDHIDCALRETFEETGIPMDRVKVWGTGNMLVPFKGTSEEQIEIMPVIGSIERFDEIKLAPCSAEVEKVFIVDLERLVDENFRRHTQFRTGRGYSTPVYVCGEGRIWGMTAILTHLFLTALLPKDLYKRKIPYVAPYRIAQ